MDLTLEEKASLCLGSDFWHTAPVPRAGIPAITLSDGPHGLRRQPDEGDHVGHLRQPARHLLPAPRARSARRGTPSSCARVGAAIGEEARAQGVDVVLGPGINIKRSPLCGRNFEYLSEDPLVAGVLGAALVEGLQSQGVGASVKHFAANNQETDRLRVSADVDERTLREIYLPGFERVVTEARPWTVMCAYNKVNGTYASEHRWLLTEVLRDEWGFDGLVMSDWGAVARPRGRARRRARPRDAAQPRRQRRRDRRRGARRRARRGGCSTRRSRACSQLVDRAPDRHRPPTSTTTPTTRSPARPPPSARCCSRTTTRSCRWSRPPATRSRSSASSPAPRATRAPAARRSTRPASTSPLDELRAAVPEGVEVAFAAGGDEAVQLAVPRDHRRRLPRPPRRRRVRGLRPHPHGPARRPARADPAARRGEPAARRRARQRLGRAALRLGAARRRHPRVLALRAGRRRRRRRPPRSARPTRRAGSPRRSRCGWRTTPPTSRSRARRATRSTARASSSATAATTRWRATSATRSATASPTRASTTTTCRRPSTATASTSAAASPTPASAAARRSPSSTSATPPPPSCVRRASSRASPRSTSSPARARR